MSNRYILTAEQIKLSEERKAKKARDAAAKTPNIMPMTDEEKGVIFDRKWLQFPLQDNCKSDHSITIMDWNMLAQCLGSDLFPTSTCLKATKREKMTLRELRRGAHIICLQEVDRLDKILPLLQQSGYLHVYASGPKKKHGCLIAFKKDIFHKLEEKVVYYDEESVRDRDLEEQSSKGNTFRTKNIGSIIALQRKDRPSVGYIIATTHLFWHPRYTYERTRQAGILVREVLEFQKTIQRTNWPCIISGDFNFTPSDPAYSMMLGENITSQHEMLLDSSRVVHVSIDPTVKDSGWKLPEEEEGGDKDKIITNARKAVVEDGLLSATELSRLYGRCFRSAIGEAQTKHKRQDPVGLTTFGDRVNLPQGYLGAHEPDYTSYTYHWKSVLDYIFVLDSPEVKSSVTGYLAFPSASELEPGLPQTNKCSSDHLALIAELSWMKQEIA